MKSFHPLKIVPEGSGLLTMSKIVLVCEGLDTISKVYLNGIAVGSSSNMFVRYIFNVKEAILVFTR
jgi:beta-galactosidase/beta-glucuronidase